MTIHLPDVQSYFEKIKNGSIINVRTPNTEIETGSVLTAFSLVGDDCMVKLKVF
jgi:hypothetical protein